MKKNNFLFIIAITVFLTACNGQNNNEPEPDTDSVATSEAFANPPDWAKEVVWYQIFVERFRNGDPTNDPTPTDIEGCYPGFVPENWRITPWTHDWYQPDPYFSELEKGTDFRGNPVTSFDAKVQLRRYGGDLQGVLDKIDYIDSLGVTAVYFNPLNDAPSLHKYDARNWRHIDRNFGPTPREDVETMAAEVPDDPSTWQMTGADNMFVEVIAELHKRGIRVILDYSWNHTGHKCWAFEDVKTNGEESEYADWYWIDAFDNPATPENEFEYKGWLGVYELPEIRETERQDHSKYIQIFDGDVASEEAKEHIFNISRRWLDPNGDGDPSDGVDGFRLDVAAEMPLGFWREYRQVVRSVNPEAYLLGEVWWEQFPDKLLDPKPFLEGDVFDAVMNYRWYRAARHFFNSSPNQIPVSEFVDSLKRFASNLRPQNNYVMMNLTASHDVPRFATSIYNKNKYKYNAKPLQDDSYRINKPDAETYETMRLILVQQFTYIGAPHIWAGDEMGMWGADDPSTRKPLIWPDYEFNKETAPHPEGLPRPADEVRFNHEWFNFYQKLIEIRNNNPVLSTGELEYILVDDANKTLAYSRFDENNEVLAVFNTSLEEKTIELPVRTEKEYVDLLNNQPVIRENNTVRLVLPARTATIVAGS